MSRRWVVREGDGASAVEILALLGEPPDAVAEGRVFVSGRRLVDAAVEIGPGQELVVHDRDPLPGGVHLLSEWRGLHAVLKPAGLATEPDRRSGASLLREAAALLGVSAGDLHAATRLDAAVSGIVVVALGPEARALVAGLQKGGQLRRRYIGLTCGSAEPRRGLWDAPIGRGPRGRATLGGRDAQQAATRYCVVADAAEGVAGVRASLAIFEPLTGRLHQIRVHAAGSGAPLLGDAVHGGPRRLVRGDGAVVSVSRVALHAARIQVGGSHGMEWTVEAPDPADLAAWWASLGGDRGAFQVAMRRGPLDVPGD